MSEWSEWQRVGNIDYMIRKHCFGAVVFTRTDKHGRKWLDGRGFDPQGLEVRVKMVYDNLEVAFVRVCTALRATGVSV